MKSIWKTIVFLSLSSISAFASDMIIRWDDSKIKYHLSSDLLSVDGLPESQGRLVRIGSRNAVSIYPYQSSEFIHAPHLNIPEKSFSFIAVFGSQIRYFDKHGVAFDFHEMLATDSNDALYTPEFHSNQEQNFSVLRFKNRNAIIKTILIYRGHLFSFSSGTGIQKLADVSINGTEVIENNTVIADLRNVEQYSSVTAYYNGKQEPLVNVGQKAAQAASMAKQFADIVEAGQAPVAQSGVAPKAQKPGSAKGTDSAELSANEAQSIEIAAKLGIKHPKDLGIKVSNGEGGTSDAWDLVRSFITDLRVKYKDQTYDPADMDQESIAILDSIIETFHASEVASVAYVGPAGSGKSEAISTFIGRLNSGTKVGQLNQFMVLELNLPGLLAAGGKYTGGTESVMNALQAILEAIPVVLVVDEVHTMKGGGATEGKPSDIRQYIKPGMARGLVRLWGISTKPEFYDAYAKDPAWIQRHRIIENPEPKGEALMKKLRAWVKGKFRGKVVVDDNILEKAIDFSNRFDAIGAQPRRAVKFLDYLIAMVRFAHNGELSNPTYDDLVRFVKRDFKVDPSIFDPTQMMPQLEKLSEKLDTSVVGQAWAKDALLRSESISLAGFQEQNRPQGRLLFVGPHGNGHSKLVQVYSELTQRPLVVIEMKNFSRPNSLDEFNKKVGDALQDNARSLFFFKNPESASSDVQKTLALMLQNGDVLVRQNDNINTASMRNAIAIVSTFVHTEDLKQLQDPGAEFDPSVLREQLNLGEDLLEQLELVPIAPLNKTEFRAVVERQVREVLKAFSTGSTNLTVTIENQDEMIQWMTDQFSKEVPSGTQSKSYLRGLGSIQSEVAIARAMNPTSHDIKLVFSNGRLEAKGGLGLCKLSLRRGTLPKTETQEK